MGGSSKSRTHRDMDQQRLSRTFGLPLAGIGRGELADLLHDGVDLEIHEDLPRFSRRERALLRWNPVLSYPLAIAIDEQQLRFVVDWRHARSGNVQLSQVLFHEALPDRRKIDVVDANPL